MTSGEVLKETARVEKLWQVLVAFVIILNRLPAVIHMNFFKSFIINIKHGDYAAALEQHFFQDTLGIRKVVKINEHAI